MNCGLVSSVGLGSRCIVRLVRSLGFISIFWVVSLSVFSVAVIGACIVASGLRTIRALSFVVLFILVLVDRDVSCGPGGAAVRQDPRISPNMLHPVGTQNGRFSGVFRTARFGFFPIT